MDIRGYSPADRETVIALWSATGLVVRPKVDPDADIDLCVRSSNAALLIGTEDEKVVGTVMVGHDAHRGWIYYLAVDPACRLKGYGRQLVAAAETWHRDHGIPKSQLMIRETNTAVEAFYRKLGYETIPRLVMQKVL